MPASSSKILYKKNDMPLKFSSLTNIEPHLIKATMDGQVRTSFLPTKDCTVKQQTLKEISHFKLHVC